MVNYRIIANLLGILLMITGLLMLTGIPFSFYYESGDAIALLSSGLITSAAGFLLWKVKRNGNNQIRKREGYLIVTLGWITMSLFGALPYLFSGAIPNITDAYFETISGFTTTGSTVLNDIEAMPKGILFWRSMTQWIGGMGIIVMAIAILPILGIGGMELFVAEAPGPTSDKIHPRIKETAKRLWAIYVLLTVACLLLLWAGGMSFFDAINHAFTTVATSGFSTKQASIGHFESAYLQYVIILFMLFSGTNYTLMYFGFRGKIKRLWYNEEFRTYAGIIILLTLVVTCFLWISKGSSEQLFREALFQVTTIITTTGFTTADYTAWAPFITLLFFTMMFLGGSAGSTGGGIKIIRHLTMAKNCMLEFKRLLHPRAVIPLKINGRIVAPHIISNVLVFVLVYLAIFAASSVVMSGLGLDFDSAIGSVAATLGNIGPGIGSVGPAGNFHHIPDVGKWFLSLLMLLGRLELYTVLILFTPYFWRST